MNIYEVSPELIVFKGGSDTVKVRLAMALRCIFSRVAVFTKEDFIQAGVDYLSWEGSGHKSENSMRTTLQFTFSFMKKHGNIVKVA